MQEIHHPRLGVEVEQPKDLTVIGNFPMSQVNT